MWHDLFHVPLADQTLSKSRAHHGCILLCHSLPLSVHVLFLILISNDESVVIGQEFHYQVDESHFGIVIFLPHIG